MRKIRLKPTESYCQKYLYTKIMTSKCKIIKYKLNANIFFQIYFCSTFSVHIQKVKINWKGLWLFERRHSKNTIWCESTDEQIKLNYIKENDDFVHAKKMKQQVILVSKALFGDDSRINYSTIAKIFKSNVNSVKRHINSSINSNKNGRHSNH